MQRLGRRGLTDQDKKFKALVENLKTGHRADEACSGAVAEGSTPSAAMPFEQKALQYLMRAEALYTEIQVTRGGGGGGGGGGASERRGPGGSVRTGTRSEQEPVRNPPARGNAAAELAGRSTKLPQAARNLLSASRS